jgi:mycoredoxin
MDATLCNIRPVVRWKLSDPIKVCEGRVVSSIFALDRCLPKEATAEEMDFYFIITSMDNLYSRNPAKIVMYSTQYCPDCLRAKAFFEANNISYVPVSIEGNPAAAAFVMEMNHGYRSVPTIVFPDGSVLVEPSWQELKEKVLK